MKTFDAFIKRIDSLITPPFKGASVFIWCSIILLTVGNQSAAIWKGNLSDPDDYLYLVQAFDWLKGQSWFDLIQHRMNPPQGTFIHFSHLLSGFYAGIIFLLQPFFGPISAALIMSVIIPPIYLAMLFFSLRWLAQKMVDPGWGDVTAYILFFCPVTMHNFELGHIDHHGLEALLAVVAFCCMTRMVERPSAFVWAMATGFVLAFGLTIGLEIVAVVGLFAICLGAWAMIEGRAATRSGLVFSLTLFISSLAFLLVTRPWPHIFDVDIQAYSIVYVILTGSMALCFASVALADQRMSVRGRCVVGGAVACMAGLIFLYCFPGFKEGPYGGLNPTLAKLIFDSATEAWPVFHSSGSWVTHALLMIWPVAAIGANLFVFLQTTSRTQRWLWGSLFVILFVCTGLAAFYQCRFLSYTEPLSTIPLVAVVWRGWTYNPQAAVGRRAFHMGGALLLLLIGPSVMIAAGNSKPDSDEMGQPGAVAQSTSSDPSIIKGCDMHSLAEILNDKQAYGSHSRLIINTLNEGTELLFRTPHTVLAAPFHFNVSGNLDALRFFTTSNPDEARMIAERRGAELVVLCNRKIQLLSYNVPDSQNGPETTFLQQLIANRVPAWLKPVRSPKFGDLMLFEIQGAPH